PTVSIGNVTALEGNSGTTLFAFTASLSAPSGVPFTYGYATEVGTAGLGSDFQYSSDYFVFGPGETSKSIGIPVFGDMIFEAEETFFVQLYDNVWDEYW